MYRTADLGLCFFAYAKAGFLMTQLICVKRKAIEDTILFQYSFVANPTNVWLY